MSLKELEYSARTFHKLAGQHKEMMPLLRAVARYHSLCSSVKRRGKIDCSDIRLKQVEDEYKKINAMKLTKESCENITLRILEASENLEDLLHNS